MFIGNFGGHVGSQDMLMNIFPHLFRQNRELVAPPPMSADSDSHRFENQSQTLDPEKKRGVSKKGSMIQQLASSSEKLNYDHGIISNDQSEKV